MELPVHWESEAIRRVALLLMVAAVTPAQQDRCRLEGRVVNSITNEPVRKVLLTLSGAGLETPLQADTDAAGHFAFPDLAPGAFAVAAERNGFESFPQLRRSRLKPLTLAPAEHKTDLVIRLMPLGAITGRILDEDGDPIPDVNVHAMVYLYTERGRELSSQDGASTNDLGEYRIHSLPPGRYYVQAEPPSERAFGPPTHPRRRSFTAAYYPGTPDAAAASIVSLNPGQQLPGIDITLRRGWLSSVSGRLARAEGATEAQVLLMQSVYGGGTSTGFMVNGPDSKFLMRNLTPGPYVLAGRYRLGDKQYEARVPIQVGAADIDGIELRPIPLVDIAGQVRVEGTTVAEVSRLQVQLENEFASHSPIAPSDTGAFAFRAVPPAVYRFDILDPEAGGKATPLYLKAVRLGAADITETGLDVSQGPPPTEVTIVVSANGGQVEGAVENERSEPAANATVTLVPASPVSPQRIRSAFKATITDATGRFRIRGIPPGSYRIFAWEEVDRNAVQYDPDFLKPFESLGKSIQISEGAMESLTLKLIRLPDENY